MAGFLGDYDEEVDLSNGRTLLSLKSKNYKMQFRDEVVKGYVDELEAMKQVVYKILNTERYEYLIYSWNYGVELKDLFGKPVEYVCPEVERRVKEALLHDNRIERVYNFVFDKSKKGVVAVGFVVSTVYGEVDIVKEVAYWCIQLVTKKF